MNKVLAQDQDPISAAPAGKPRSGALKPIPEDALILIPLRNNVLFPGVISPITVGRPGSVAACSAGPSWGGGASATAGASAFDLADASSR